MNRQEIKEFFQNIQKFKLTRLQKKRMLRLFQVRGSNNKNRSMSYKSFIKHVTVNNGNIKKLIIGPKWNRLVFVDIDIEV